MARPDPSMFLPYLPTEFLCPVPTPSVKTFRAVIYFGKNIYLETSNFVNDFLIVLFRFSDIPNVCRPTNKFVFKRVPT